MIITEEKTEQKMFLDSKTFKFYNKPLHPQLRELCTTCIHRKMCCLTTVKPVVECEEFLAEAREEKMVRNETIPRQKLPDESAINEEKYQGLCVNCENRCSCPLSATEGGIWYCEEYC